MIVQHLIDLACAARVFGGSVGKLLRTETDNSDSPRCPCSSRTTLRLSGFTTEKHELAIHIYYNRERPQTIYTMLTESFVNFLYFTDW